MSYPPIMKDLWDIRQYRWMCEASTDVSSYGIHGVSNDIGVVHGITEVLDGVWAYALS